MNFLDSLFDKIPIIRDMDKKKRILLVGFAVFAVISILGILIEAIVGASGIIAVTAVVVGFLFMAAIILIDFFMSKRSNADNPPMDDGYNFFSDLNDDNIPYQNDSFDSQMTDDNFADNDYGANTPGNDFTASAQNGGYSPEFGGYEPNPTENGGYTNEFGGYGGQFNNGSSFEISEQTPNYAQPSYEEPEQGIEYTTEPEQIPEEPAPRRFGGIFRRGQVNENTAISDEINSAEREFNQNSTYNNEYDAVRSSFEFTREPDMPAPEAPLIQADEPIQPSYSAQPADSRQPAYGYPQTENQSFGYQPNEIQKPVQSYQPTSANNYESDYIGKPVMTFPTSAQPLQSEISRTADFVAPNMPAPSMSDNIGGPVMSIPMRSSYSPTVTESPSKQVQSYSAPAYQQQYSAEPRVPAYQQGTRGQEIEEFFDHMSEDELLYSDCVEVWASDAKPAAIRLLKQIELLPDKKKADALGREAEYVNAMLDRIYYFTMLDSIRDNLELKKYNFSVMVKECLRRFSPFFMEKRIGLLWKGLDIDIITDKRWLIFALTQVVFNAVEFTGLGGKIAISAKKEGSLIHLMVDDSGCGISENDLPRIFMAGFMGDNVPNESGRRTGMGLFITRSVVEKLGGTVTADSTVGKGTRITIILPERP
ncbi:MAG: ATP-binding protein [Firmicutes bacterium]|nr:ATP-binding protein [Bacillota bacterium]